MCSTRITIHMSQSGRHTWAGVNNLSTDAASGDRHRYWPLSPVSAPASARSLPSITGPSAPARPRPAPAPPGQVRRATDTGPGRVRVAVYYKRCPILPDCPVLYDGAPAAGRRIIKRRGRDGAGTGPGRGRAGSGAGAGPTW